MGASRKARVVLESGGQSSWAARVLGAIGHGGRGQSAAHPAGRGVLPEDRPHRRRDPGSLGPPGG